MQWFKSKEKKKLDFNILPQDLAELLEEQGVPLTEQQENLMAGMLVSFQGVVEDKGFRPVIEKMMAHGQ